MKALGVEEEWGRSVSLAHLEAPPCGDAVREPEKNIWKTQDLESWGAELRKSPLGLGPICLSC